MSWNCSLRARASSEPKLARLGRLQQWHRRRQLDRERRQQLDRERRQLVRQRETQLRWSERLAQFSYNRAESDYVLDTVYITYMYIHFSIISLAAHHLQFYTVLYCLSHLCTCMSSKFQPAYT